MYKAIAGKQLAVRPVLDTERPNTHGWSLGASDGDHNIRLDAMDEGLTRLVASLPSDEAESQGIALTAHCETLSQTCIFCSTSDATASSLDLLSHVSQHVCLLLQLETSTGSLLAMARLSHQPVVNVSFWVRVTCHLAGKDAVTQGKNSLAAKLAASPVWLSLTLDAETFPSTGQQVFALESA